MARLNEVPASTSTESIESLKRKFMRQNRDIARANSSQSLRIRNLENEISRLLAENLGQREQILRLQGELKDRQGQRIAEQTATIKSQLEEKLVEISALINGLGNGPPKKNSQRVGKITRASPKTSPDQKNWKNMCTLSEAVAGQDGKLPPILENKLYPRRTLESQELGNIISSAEVEVDTMDSPEIGPPPVSQFVDEDPVKIDFSQRSRKNDLEGLAGLDPALSMNLEQRKKRKDSIGPSESKRVEIVEPTQNLPENKASLKTGAKRKLSVREDEEPEAGRRIIASSPDDFKFRRVSSEDRPKTKATPQPGKSADRITRELAVARGVTREKRSSTTISTGRKALAPKSVNDSPKKNTKAIIQDDVKATKADIPKMNLGKEHPREKKQEPVSVRTREEPLTDTVEIQPEPETPAGVDIFSPLSSQPSTARVESRDTPPPTELGSGTEGQRPSRRARGAVSYAEPNLRDKMRRPTKELVDAVTVGGKPTRESGMAVETTIKSEPEDEDAWRQMPVASSATVENSPLKSKAPDAEILPNSITTHRKRRESILHQMQEGSKTSSETAISALIAEHRKAKAAAREKLMEKDGALMKSTENLEISESNGSSPTESAITKPVEEEKTMRKPTRRHSSIPQELGSVEDGVSSDMEAPKKKEILTSRRRQSTLGLKNATTSTEQLPEKTLKKATSATMINDSAAGDARSDRISARRRSMML